MKPFPCDCLVCATSSLLSSIVLNLFTSNCLLGHDTTTGDECGIQSTMSKFGHLQEFRSDVESVTAHLECMELFFTANEIADNKKVAVFLNSMGSTMYALLQDLRPFHTRPKKRIQCASNAHSSCSHLNPVWAMRIRCASSQSTSGGELEPNRNRIHCLFIE